MGDSRDGDDDGLDEDKGLHKVMYRDFERSFSD